MSVYKVALVGDPVLTEKAQPIKKVNDGVLRLLDNLRDTLYEMNGAGLAAPQIGVSRRAIVVDVDGELYEMVNPEIVHAEGEQADIEGCLSAPGLKGMVKRWEKVEVKGLDRRGEEYKVEASGLLARAFQHEIDHLDGIMFMDLAEWVAKQE